MEPNDRTEKLTRRDALQKGAGLASAPVLMAAGLGAAQQQSGGPNNGNLPAGAPVLQNPVGMYPKPPFQKQPQPWPGLQSRMIPVPDCGEKSYQGSGKLAGRKALITGGDSGIGRAVAIAYAREGADVAIAYLPQEEPDAREVVAQIRAAGRKAVPLTADIRDEGACQKLVSDAINGLGGLDILVNNAGRQQAHQSILEISTEQFDWTFKTNCYALFWITRAALPHMPAGSAIINTASVEALKPDDYLFDYAATKAAIVIFTKVLAKQLGPKGIRVNAVAPGPYWTVLQVTGGAPEKKYEEFGKGTVFGRPGQPAEIAATYVLLASPQATMATGEVWTNTGGTAPF